jgi:hypothetical protein
MAEDHAFFSYTPPNERTTIKQIFGAKKVAWLSGETG